MASAVDEQQPANGITYIYLGTAKIPDTDKVQNAFIIHHSNVNTAVANRSADVLIQQKMVEVGYVHNGWSTNRNLLQSNWNQWLENTAIYADDTTPELRQLCLDTIQSRVKHFSTKWRKLGLWQVEERHSCMVCKTAENKDKDRGESNVYFSPWLQQQTQTDEWNGEFTESPPTILCPTHLSVSMAYSPGCYMYSVEVINSLQAQLNDLLQNVLQAQQE